MVRSLFGSRSLSKVRRRNVRAPNHAVQQGHRPRMEALEGRAMLAAFAQGNLALLVAGSSTANNTTGSIVEVNTTSAGQAAVQTIALPDTTSVDSFRMSGSATSTGYVSRSNDGSLLSFTGHNSTTTGTTNANTLNPRAVYTVSSAGTVVKQTTYTGTSGSQTRGATSLDNVNWYIGDQGGLYTNGATTAGVTGNYRSMKAFGGTVYGFSPSTTVASVGTFTSLSGGTFVPLPGMPVGAAANMDFSLISSGDHGSAFDVLYVTTATSATAGTIAKYSLQDTNSSGVWGDAGDQWAASGSYTTTFGGFGLAAADNGNGALLYVSTGSGATAANSVVKVADTAGWNATMAVTASNNVTLYTTATGTVIKGLDFAPRPAPTLAITGAATATAFTTTYGTASAAQTFSISGSNLTADLVATAPTGFEVSSDGTNYGAIATFTRSGSSASGTLSVRLAAAAVVTGSYNSQNIVLSSTGATSVNIATAASGNAVAAKGLTISGVTIADKTYDGTTSATTSGSPAYSGLANGESFSVTGTASATFDTAGVGTGKSVTVVGYTAPSTNYAVSQPSATGNVTARSLTVTANNVTKTVGQTLTSGSGSTAFTSSGLAAPGGVAETIGSVAINYGTGAAASDPVGTYTGQVTPAAATGGTFDPNNYSISYVAGDITVSSAPTISPSGTLSGVSTTYGTASSVTTFTVSGGFLTGDLTVAAPTGFQVSADGTTYGSSVTLVASGGTVASTTISVRLAAATAAGSYSGNVTISGGGATTQNVAVPASAVSPATLTVSGLIGVPKEYDGLLAATVTGTPAFSGLQNGESFTVGDSITWAYAAKTVGAAKTLVASGSFTAPSANYTVTQPAVTASITAKPLTVTGATAANKPYDGTTAATITGVTLVGVVSGDTVTLTGGGTFAQATPGTSIAVTAGFSPDGADGGNYVLTQPTGLAADITTATQTITFGPLSSRLPSAGPFTLAATATSGLAVTYASSNPLVATVSGNTVTIVGPGSTTITASQAGDGNYDAAADVPQPFTVMTPLTAGDIAFTGIQTDTTDTFSFVLLRDVVAGTEINFTDNGWSGTALGTAEGIVTATFSSNFAAGSHFVIVGESTKTFSLVGGGLAGAVVVPTTFGLSTSGDSILAYQGAAPTSGASASWLAGVYTVGGWAASATGTNQSALPAALANGTTAIAFPVETDDGAYNLSTFTGTMSEILASVNNVANWTLSNNAGPMSTTSFTVVRTAPAIASPTATAITDTTATLGGTVTNDGGDAITERGIVYAATSANADPLIGGSGVTKLTASGTIGAFSVPVSGLVTATGYSFKAYATNAQGTTYTTVSTVTTAAVPTVSGPTATAVATSSATLGGTVDADGGLPITERGVVYSLTSDSALTVIGAAGVTKIVVSGTTGVFTTPVAGLTASSSYAFRAYATNAVGTSYSAVGTFSTPAAATAPVVTTPTVTGVGETTATLSGTVSSDGGSTITEIGVVFAPTGANADPTIGGTGVTKVTATGTTGVFTVPLTGLAGATGYSFKAYATNGVGTTYSTGSTFATPASTTVSLTGVSPLTATAGSAITFSGTVVAGSGAATPAGTVEIRVGGASGQLLASTTTIGGVGGNGTFSITTSSIAIGSYSGIQAFFIPGSGFQTSSSAAFESTLTVSQAAFTPGNLLVLQVGDGTTPITYTSAGNAFTGGVMLLEYSPTGTLVQAIPVASSGGSALTLRLNSTSEGVLSLSSDRQRVTFGGHRVDVGASNPNTSTTPRVIGKVSPDGAVDTAQAIANVFSGDSLRSVVTDDGTNFWMSGAGTNSSGGIEYVAGPSATTATALTGLTNPNTRQIQIIDGNLFVGGGANTPGRSVFQVGSGLPNTGNQALTSSLPLAAAAQYQSFSFADLDGTVSWRNTGFDTLYATDSNSGAVVKFSYVVNGGVGVWTARGSLALTGAGSLVGYVSPGGVTLYVTSTTGTTGVSTVTDTTGYNADFSALTLSSLATPAVPGANYGFRGISFVPRAGITTTTTVTNVTPATVDAGSSVAFTATVVAATGTATPTGSVQFRSGDVLLATAPITGTGATGTATVSTTAIPFGTYTTITAQYVPDGNPSANLFNPSTSAAYATPLVVAQPGVVTTTTLSSVTWAAAPAAAAYGDSVTFTGTVATADSSSPVGTVEIRDGGPTGTLLASGSSFGAGGTFTITSSAAIPSGTYANMAAYFVAGSGYKNSNSAASTVSLTILQTTLGLGDIAFTGYQATGTDKITFVLLKDVIAGTTFTLTDAAWTGTALASSEGTSTLTLTQAFSAGTVFDFDFARSAGARWQWGSNTASGGSAAGIQETTTASFGLNSSGDNLFIYQGAMPTTGTASGWVAAFSSSSFLTTGVAGTDQTYLPAALTEGVNAFSLGLAGQAANQNGGLNDLGTVTGSATTIRTTVYTLGNWTISAGNVAMPSPTVFTVSSVQNATPVKVTGVYAKGSAWNATYLALSPFTTVGSDALGWAMVDGANQLAATSSLTWSNIDTISLQFNQPISQPAAAALKLVLGDNQGDQTITPSSTPALLAGGTIAQWSVPALANGKYVISCPSSGIADAGGTTVLDGDWITGTSTFAEGSGDGTAGGTFNFFFNVLVADVNGSGNVNNTDTTSVRNQLFAAVSADNFRNDFNGSNSINNTDVTALRNKLFGALASYQSPTAPDAVLPSINSPIATSVGATSATLGGTVTSDGGEVVLERGVVLAVTGTNADPLIGGTGTVKIVATGSTGLFNVLASGLLSGTNYSFKAYVRTSKGLTYTVVSTFTTT